MKLGLTRGLLPLWACLMVCSGVWPGAVLADAPLPTLEPLEQVWLREGQARLSPGEFAREAIARNAATMASRAKLSSVSHLVEAERSIYDPTVSVQVSRTFDKKPRPSADISADVQRLINCAVNPDCEGSIDDLQLNNEQSAQMFEYGVQMKLPTGAQVSVTHNVTGARSNLSDPINLLEARGSLQFSMVQPLLKGWGRGATEADLAVAELEYMVEQQNLVRQILDTIGESVGTYWHLFQAEQSIRLREEAVANAERIVDEVRKREAAGFGNELERQDALVALGTRQSDLIDAQQNLVQVQARVRNALNLSGQDFEKVVFRTDMPSAQPDQALAVHGFDESAALKLWPSYRIAQLRLQQEDIRLQYANNQRKPELNAMLSYSQSSMNNTNSKAFKDALDSRYQGWSVGLSLQRPLFNGSANSKYEAQGVKLMAAKEDVNAERMAWTNEVVARRRNLDATVRGLKLAQEMVTLRESSLQLQRQQVQAGRARVRLLLEREDQLSNARILALDALVALKIARLQFSAVVGKALERYGVALQTR